MANVLPLRSVFISLAMLIVACALCGPERAHGDLKWQSPKKEEMRLRIVALAWNHPRSSFFLNEEIFIAEKQLEKDESRLVKLVFGFLPYQPRLSDSGLDYSTLHEMRAARDPECDETLGHMLTGEVGDWRKSSFSLRYSKDAPALNLDRHRNPLPCYITDAEDYGRPLTDPSPEPPPDIPHLKPRN